MRFYTFTNMYLSSIQKGIQSAHAAHEIMLDKEDDSDTVKWARDHKTMIVLDGGFTSDLQTLGDFLGGTNFESVTWSESEEALGGALTCVGVVLPERIYMLAQYARQNVVQTEVITEGSETSHAVYRAVPATEELKENEELLALLDGFGEYSEQDIVFINELNKYRLAV